MYTEDLKNDIKVYRRSGPKPLLSFSSLKLLEERLPSLQFMRVHGSFIIALQHIKSVTGGTVQIGYITVPVVTGSRNRSTRF